MIHKKRNTPQSFLEKKNTPQSFHQKKYFTGSEGDTPQSLCENRKKTQKRVLTKKTKSGKNPIKAGRKKKLNQTGKKSMYGKIPYRKATEKF